MPAHVPDRNLPSVSRATSMSKAIIARALFDRAVIDDRIYR